MFKSLKGVEKKLSINMYNMTFMQFDRMTSIFKLFLEAVKYDSGSSKREIFIHETCATDTENVKRVFEDVQVIPRVYFIFIHAKAK